MNYSTLVQTFLKTPADQWVHVSGNHVYAFCKADVNMRLVSSLEDEDVQEANFVEAWANNFPAPRASGYYYNLYYGSTLVKRFILVSVDGARVSLPIPVVGSMEVTEAQWKVAEIFDTSNQLDQYAKRTGMTVGTDPGL